MKRGERSRGSTSSYITWASGSWRSCTIKKILPQFRKHFYHLAYFTLREEIDLQVQVTTLLCESRLSVLRCEYNNVISKALTLTLSCN